MKVLSIFIVGIFVCDVWCSVNTTRNPDFLDRILSRKKRFLLFPPGSAVVATMSFTKSLVPRSPSGINMIAEVDIFYPLQTKIADYYPKPPPPPPDEEEGEEEGEEEEELPVQPAPQPQPAPQQKPAPSDAPMARPKPPTAILQDGADNYNTQNHPGEIYVTGPPRRIASSEVLDNFVYRNPQYSHRNEIFWRPTKPVYPMSPVRYTPPPFHRNGPSYVRPFSSSNLDKDNMLFEHLDSGENIRPPNTILYSRLRSQQPKWYEARGHPIAAPVRSPSEYYMRRGRSSRTEPDTDDNSTSTSAFDDDDIENHRDWHHYHRYKERRDIYEQLQAITSFEGIDIKTCIYRMICEANHFLLPPGKSLFQDVFRILFTLPQRPGLNDAYSNAMQKNATECREHFGIECRYSILGFLLNNRLKGAQ